MDKLTELKIWSLTVKEWKETKRKLRYESIEKWNKNGSKGMPPTLGLETISNMNNLALEAGFELPRDATRVIGLNLHTLAIMAAIKNDLPIPSQVLAEYNKNS